MSREGEFNDEKHDQHTRKSKTQRKKEMTALQKLGEELVNLKADQLKKMPLPEELFRAVLEAQRMKTHGARRRQMQYLGAVMRQVDAESVREALGQLMENHGREARGFHLVEEWRDRLVEGDQDLTQELCERFSKLEPGELHRMVMNARRERETGKPKGAGRALFRRLMEHYRQSHGTGKSDQL